MIYVVAYQRQVPYAGGGKGRPRPLHPRRGPASHRTRI